MQQETNLLEVVAEAVLMVVALEEILVQITKEVAVVEVVLLQEQLLQMEVEGLQEITQVIIMQTMEEVEEEVIQHLKNQETMD